MPVDPELWASSVGELISAVLLWLPRVVGSLLWLLVGWLIARVFQTIIANVLRRVGFDRIAERAGVRQMLADAGFDASASWVLARIVYWLILLLFVIAAAESLGLTGVVDTLEALIGYLPNVLAAALILLLGSLLARLVGDAVGSMSGRAGITGGEVAGQLVRYALLIFVFIVTLGQLGIETALLTTVTVVLITATTLALALAFGLGSRDLARNIMAGLHARDTFAPGQELHVGQHRGRLLSIGAVKAVIETEEGLVSLPNARLTEEEVTVLVEGTGPAVEEAAPVEGEGG